MLVAPAGFGKSTLAEQWTRSLGGRSVWYPCRAASADVAALAMGIAVAASELLPGCERRLRERLAVSQNPADEVDILAELLADDISAWPADAWLVVDDYQLLCRAAEAELFVKLLIANAPVNVLIASRRRPSWVSSRDILRGEILEVNQTELAMSREEAELVLDLERDREGITSGLVAIANGWPAVLALAGVSGVPELPDDNTPEALYDFFAEEVYRGLTPADRAGLGMLAATSLLDRELVEILLGAERAEHTLAEGTGIGVIVERGERLELHPLARAFIEAKALAEWPTEHASAVERSMVVYRARHDWDSAYDLIERNELIDELEGLMTEALDELLEAARLPTLADWVTKAEAVGLEQPIFPIAHAEVALRAGSSMKAQTLAERATSLVGTDDPLMIRGLMVAGSSAHVGSREELALEFFKRAERFARNQREEMEALWGQMMCLAELEHEDAASALERLEAESSSHDPRDLVRLATRRLGFELRAGSIESLDSALEARQLLEFVSDAFVRTSFRSMLAVSLVLRADYEIALQVATELLADAEANRLDFAIPYALCAAAGAEAGVQNFEKAERLARAAIERASEQDSLQARLNATAARLRILLHQARIDEACAEALLPTAPVPSLQGELLAVRGLAVACSGRVNDALKLAARAAQSTNAVETRVLVSAIEAIAALRSGEPTIRERLESLIATSNETQAFDLMVTAYRACPDLLALLLKNASTRDETWSIINKSRDEKLAAIVGVPVPSRADPRSLLSPREQDVYDLLCQSLSNAQIARCLFISEATVKVHVHHIFDKTGTRSRTTLAVNAARAQVRQATSAMPPTDTESSV